MIFDRTYGIDLGSEAVKIFSGRNGKTLSEKNRIAYRGHDIIAVGTDAAAMTGKIPADTFVVSPTAFGKVDSLELQEIVLYSFMKRMTLLPNGSVIYFTVPPDLSAIDKRAFYYAVNGSYLHGNRVYTVDAPVADAFAMGFDLENTQGSMLVNVGHSTTRFGIFFSGKMIMNRLIPIGGKNFDDGIIQEIRKRYQLQVGPQTAENLKISIGRLLGQRKEERKVVGIDTVSGLPKTEMVSSFVVNAGIMNTVNELAEEIKIFLERIPPQVSYQVAREGIALTGGSSHIPFLDKYLAGYTGFTFNLSKAYEFSGVRGLEIMIREGQLKSWAQPIRMRKLR